MLNFENSMANLLLDSFHFTQLLQPQFYVENGGLWLLLFVVFAETGLFVGFFLPGDTLLFTAGFFAAQGKLPLIPLLLLLVVAAVLGDNVGYSFGRRTGHRIFKKKDFVLFPLRIF